MVWTHICIHHTYTHTPTLGYRERERERQNRVNHAHHNAAK